MQQQDHHSHPYTKLKYIKNVQLIIVLYRNKTNDKYCPNILYKFLRLIVVRLQSLTQA